MYLKQLLPSSGYVVCPGIKEYPDQIRFDTKNLRQWGPPFNRKFSANCYQWHVPNNAQQLPGSIAFDCCKPCKQLLHDINQLALRANTTTQTQRMSRTLPSSKYPLSKLSPASQKIRVTKVIVDRQNVVQKLNKLRPFDYEVNDKQHAELLQLTSAVHTIGSKVINELVEEGSRVLGEDNVLKDSWHQDVVERLDYERDQQRSGKEQFLSYYNNSLLWVINFSHAVTKNRGNRWNQVTIRMGEYSNFVVNVLLLEGDYVAPPSLLFVSPGSLLS